ncbi:MAG: MFS transporter [Betaproteobacteria bacterium]|nr:MFS transporter [Betaproteobacteria bacterium]
MEGMGYRMAGMPMSMEMLGGMAAILAGLGLATYGVVPRLSALAPRRDVDAELHIHGMDNAGLTGAHWWLLFVLGIALVIDVMKPATLGFVLPGMRQEYGFTTAQVAFFPFVALTGTTIGSILWGVMGDRLGRRATILLASLFFIGTSICGFMPSFQWNLFMCFLMGLSAGGMLPIVYALMAETVPARMRGWLVILHGGLATACGYLVASGLATLFEPTYTWRILWFFGLPTGLIIILLNRWIPESPRFLLQRGNESAARAVMSRFGIVVEKRRAGEARVPAAAPSGAGAKNRVLALFRRPYALHSMTIVLYGLGWGLVNWGFITFLPTVLRDAGFKVGTASALLFYSSLAAIPGTLLVAFLYGRWSSRKTMITFAALTSAVMIGFAVLSPGLGSLSQPAIVLLGMVLMVSCTAVISMLSPYAAEVYPTPLRGTGSGIAAGSSKLGGMVGPPLMGLLLTTSGTPMIPILAMGIPIGFAALVLCYAGLETRGKGLEQIADRVRS